ncbi:fatty acid desaturase family protein [Sorangium sp. So ce1182]|uniref:fatty acid desaturase family protein n=1 Tax=Sorangium sp. So ce1182 TaxID=3133334 RepID=UPI003F61E295
MSRSRVFRFSRWDVASVAVIPFQVTVYIVLAYAYKGLPPLALVAMVPVLFALSLQNAGANHNHYHTPFFRAGWLNTLATMGFSMTGTPKTPYNIGHGLHHATAQSWNDESILEILGLKRPLHKQLLAFSMYVVESLGLKHLVLLVLLKQWPLERVARLAVPKDPAMGLRLLTQLQQGDTLLKTKLDIAAWVAFRATLCAIDWKFFFFYFIPVTYLIDTLRQAENYLQHWGAADPMDPKRDSVSCYATLYNLLTFNLGYHQEHHLRPGVHWLKLSRTTAELPAARRIVPFTHYINLPIFYSKMAAELASRRAGAGSGTGDLRSAEGIGAGTAQPGEASSNGPLEPSRS